MVGLFLHYITYVTFFSDLLNSVITRTSQNISHHRSRFVMKIMRKSVKSATMPNLSMTPSKNATHPLIRHHQINQRSNIILYSYYWDNLMTNRQMAIKILIEAIYHKIQNKLWFFQILNWLFMERSNLCLFIILPWFIHFDLWIFILQFIAMKLTGLQEWVIFMRYFIPTGLWML